MHDTAFRRELGQQLRVDAVRMAGEAGSGHPTSSMSAADLVAVLIDGHLRLDPSRPHQATNDRLIFSKGHASPLYYAMLRALGEVTAEELRSYRRAGSRLEGHPTPRAPLTDVATGSLGQGMPIAVGVALAARDLDRVPSRTWVLCGDSELAEGSIWEAAQHAGWAGLDNLVVLVDVNRLGQRGETMLGRDTAGYRRRFEAFGWEALEVDGHDLDAVEQAYQHAERATGRPVVIIASTVKGKGVAEVEDQPGRHGKPLDDSAAAIAELGGDRDLRVEPARPEDAAPTGAPSGSVPTGSAAGAASWPRYDVGDQVATRKAFGAAAAALGSVDGRVVVLDGEVDNSTGAASFAEAHPERYYEMFIAEQQMVAAAVGMQTRGYRPVATSFAAFFTRAYDFVRMAAVSRATMALVGSHAGVSIGPDGPSQMALEDMASMRAIGSSTVLHPSDATQATALTAQLADREGITFLRTLRGETTVRTPAEEDVRIGGSRVVDGPADGSGQVAIVACGATVEEAVAAAAALRDEGITAHVLDCYSVKPLDAAAVIRAARGCGAVVTVEDHRAEGGLGDAVLEALAAEDALDGVRVRKLAVEGMPASGTPEELRAEAGIDAAAIQAAAHHLANRVAVGT